MTSLKFEEMIPLAALGKLTAREQISFEAAMADQPELATALREYEEIVAGLWQSASPLRTMPRPVWEEIRERVNPSSSVSFFPRRVGAWLGWAAALLMGVTWFILGTGPLSDVAVTELSLENEEREVAKPGLSDRVLNERPTDPGRREIFDLRESLRAIGDRDEFSTVRPRIMVLRHPDSPILGSAETRIQRLMDLLTMALQADLQRLSEEEVTLIIEEGWPEAGLHLGPETVVRHRNFPEEEAGALGLLVSEEGHFLDLASSMLWKPAPDGGGFLGSLAPSDLDFTAFEIPREPDPQVASRDTGLSLPEGYVITAGNRNASPTFVFNNLDADSGFVSLRQGSSLIPLRTGAHQVTSTASPSGSPTLFTLPSDSASGFRWGSPFEVIRTTSAGVDRVILTNGP